MKSIKVSVIITKGQWWDIILFFSFSYKNNSKFNEIYIYFFYAFMENCVLIQWSDMLVCLGLETFDTRGA